MRYKLVFSYDGSNYYGYAIQKNESKTIQATIEKALSIIFSKSIKISASGRTDKGVHALAQVATFDVESKINKAKVLHSLNKLVPHDIYFKSISLVPDTFDARFSAVSKEYIYVINYAEYLPFFRSYEACIKDVNIKKMKQCAKLFIGEHCFKNFTSKPSDEGNFVRTIFSIKFQDKANHLFITFKGDGFMTYMIRKLVGAMLEVANDNLTLEDISDFLNNQKRDIITYTAQANGLFLKKVNYKSIKTSIK